MPADTYNTHVSSREQRPTVSVVVLCFNDHSTITQCIAGAYRHLAELTRDLQIVVVEDGSSDDSKSVLKEAQDKWVGLEVIWHSHNQGYGQSLSDGIARARNEYVFCSDGDGQFDFKDAPQLLALASPATAVVSGIRVKRCDQWYRRLLGTAFRKTIHTVFTDDVEDIDCGFKLLHRPSIQSFFPTECRMAVWVELMLRVKLLGLRAIDTPVTHRPRQTGRSMTFRPRNLICMLKEMVWLFCGLRVFGTTKSVPIEQGDKVPATAVGD